MVGLRRGTLVAGMGVWLVAVIVAMLRFGAAIGSIISPAQVVLDCSSTGHNRREGIVMRAMLHYVIVILALIGAVT